MITHNYNNLYYITREYMKTCKTCKKEKEDKDFYQYDNNFDLNTNACKECRNEIWKRAIESTVSFLDSITK